MYRAIKAFCKILNLFPLPCALFLGRLIGLGLYCNRRKRKTAFLNIKQTFPEKSDAELSRIIKASFFSFGMSLIEILLIDRIKDNVEIHFKERREGEGGVLVGLHQGNWELYNARFGSIELFAILVKRQKNYGLDKFINEVRRKNGIHLCATPKELLRFIKDGYWTGLVVDHGAEKNAKYINFFDHIVPTPGGAVRIAKKYNKKIYLSFGRRRKTGHIVIVEDAITVEGKTEEELLREMNYVCEGFLRRYPEQYLWWYKRFKRKKDRNILILSDGKAGHLKQSLSLLSQFKESEYLIREQVVNVEYRNRVRRVLANFFALFSRSGFFCRWWCLKFLLKSNLTDILSGHFFDVVISAGSICAPVNALFSHMYGARSCVILKPSVPLANFSLAILPEHDRHKGANILCIKGALTRFESLKEEAEKGKAFFRFSGNKKIAFFVGNSQHDEEGFAEKLRVFLNKLKKFAIENGFSLLVTTSRRTHRLLERILQEELEGFANLEVFIRVSKKNYPFVVPTFLSFSDIVFVTAESVSMVTESLYLKKVTVCVFLEEIKKENHKRFLNSLKNGFVNFFKYPYDNFEFKKAERSIKEENDAVLKEAVRRLL